MALLMTKELGNIKSPLADARDTLQALVDADEARQFPCPSYSCIFASSNSFVCPGWQVGDMQEATNEAKEAVKAYKREMQLL